MRWIPKKGKSSHLLILIYAGRGVPLSLRLSLARCLTLGSVLGMGVIISLLGTMLFLREVELNRKLSERVLEFEVKQKLAKTKLAVESFLPTLQVAEVSSVSDEASAESVPATKVEPPTKTENREVTSEVPVESLHRARLSDLSVECLKEKCGVKLALLPTAAGFTEGQILIVLETEVPRIGTAVASGNVRKRFLVYPGYESYDELGPEMVSSLTAKSFRFSRVLQTTADFAIGKLLRPLAVNVYVYDAKHNLVQHERKPMDPVE